MIHTTFEELTSKNESTDSVTPLEVLLLVYHILPLLRKEPKLTLQGNSQVAFDKYSPNAQTMFASMLFLLQHQ